MQDEIARLVAEIRRRASGVRSFVCRYHYVSTLELLPMEAAGKTQFLAPDNFRSEISVNDDLIITVRRGSEVQRSVPKRKEIWRYNLKDLPQTLPINAGVADLNGPFFAVDEDTLSYEGRTELEGAPAHAFTGKVRSWKTQGLLDTRKGFSINYQPKSLEVEIKLWIDIATGLLRRTVGTGKSGEKLLEVSYAIDAINIPLDESLFSLDESTADFSQVDMTDMMFSSLNPDIADAPPSQN